MRKGGWGSAAGVKYVPKSERGPMNAASQHFSGLYKSERSQVEVDPGWKAVLMKGCTYLPNFFGATTDLRVFEALKAELVPNNLTSWSQHFKIENPDTSETFNKIVAGLRDHFDVDVLQTRVNYYRDGQDFKPWHHDSHAYSGSVKDRGESDGTERKTKEDFTMGVSFGASRQLDFKHPETGLVFSFPQNNGDVFAFDAEVNKLFMHGVPKAPSVTSDRISVICWGKTRQTT